MCNVPDTRDSVCQVVVKNHKFEHDTIVEFRDKGKTKIWMILLEEQK